MFFFPEKGQTMTIPTVVQRLYLMRVATPSLMDVPKGAHLETRLDVGHEL